MTEFNIEEAVAWNVMRAAREAIDKAPNLDVDEDVSISVEIRLATPNWPGRHESGKRKSTIIGSASCMYAYRNRTEDGQ